MKILAAILSFSLAVTAAPCLAEYVVITEIGADRFFAFSDVNSIADFDGDGQLEVVLGVFNDIPGVRIYDAMTGQVEAEVTLPGLGSSYVGATAVKLDDDLLPEIIAFGVDRTGVSDLYRGYAVVDFVGTSAASSSVEPRPTPDTTVRPNPFNPSATIDYAVPHAGTASLQVFDAAGRLVRTLIQGKMEAGKQSVTWDGRDNSGQALSSGTYFYSLSLDGQVLDKGKAVMLK